MSLSLNSPSHPIIVPHTSARIEASLIKIVAVRVFTQQTLASPSSSLVPYPAEPQGGGGEDGGVFRKLLKASVGD